MSGVEVIGVVLGVLPLLISAAEHYEDVFKPFKRFKKYAPELEQYQQQLKTQRTIFLNQCQLLLTSLTNRESAKEMLRQKTHPSWNNENLKERLKIQLGTSREACEATVELIAQKLKTIEGEVEGFGSILQQSLPLHSIGDKAWRSRIQKKLKFSFSESRLGEYLGDLRKLNHDFRTLAKQTTSLDDHAGRKSSPQVTTVCPAKKVGECRLVQRASTQLYKAMGRACKHHLEHSAQFQLLPQNVSSSDTDNPFIRFNLAFTHGVSGNSAALDPVWIAVESSFTEANNDLKSEPTPTLEAALSLKNTLSHNINRNDLPFQKKPRLLQKRVRFQTNCSKNEDANAQRGSVTITKTIYHDASLPDFCVQHNFCQQLRKSCGYARSPENKYLGYFQKTGPYKHLVSFAAPISVHNYTNPESLTSIISAMSERPEIDQFLEYERLRLASRLASAVLQFHATPLLGDFWGGNDVVFFGKNDKRIEMGDFASLELPYLNVRVGSSKSGRLESRDPQATDKATEHLIRNPYIFSLGVTLIELAFQAPLRSLYESDELINGQFTTLSDFFVATRLSKRIGPSLGSTYGTVVMKCLGCDFGQGTSDLKDSKLQAVFHQDVVCELERLERGFAMLQLGD